MIAKDKKQHFMVGFGLALLFGLLFGYLIGFVAAVAAQEAINQLRENSE